MTGRGHRTLLAALLAGLAAAGCSRATTSSPPTPAGALSAAEIDSIYRARLEANLRNYSEADVRFMAGMIHHHAQALEMSHLAPTHGASPSVQTLAARIINAQRDEIASMQRWLRDRGEPVPEVHVAGDGSVMVHGHDHLMHMPGMLSPEQMRELKEARGREFDRLFLRYMIQHHEGAVVMVRELFDSYGAAQEDATFKFVSDIQADQSTEIARMQRMLEALGGRE